MLTKDVNFNSVLNHFYNKIRFVQPVTDEYINIIGRRIYLSYLGFLNYDESIEAQGLTSSNTGRAYE